MYEAYLVTKVEEQHKRFCRETGMVQTHVKPWNGGSGGYHTRISGDLHNCVDNTQYANSVFHLRKEEYYEEAVSCLKNIIKAQDTRPGSKTYGLWPYFVEEDCDHMIAPDYNMADFNGKCIAYILKARRDCIDDETAALLTESLMRAAECSMKRNVSPDYTNISLMSLNTIILAGELSGNKAFLERGKERLRKVHRYDMFCGSYSEYNSPAYTPLAIEELSMMVALFEDEECKKLAEDLNHLAWEMLLKHYDKRMKQLAPPAMRSYGSFTGDVEEMIYLGTNGRYGYINEEKPSYTAMLRIPPYCPEDLVEKYVVPHQENVWIDETFYKKNNIRTPDEDTVIVRNIDSPDLKAFTYISDGYSMGAFEKTDMWTQRRSSMIYWGDEAHKTSLRIRCINKDYDYCSGMVYTNQFENVMLSHCGFVSDRGDFHYILDKTKDGTLTTEKLFFKFELEGDCENVKVTQDGGRFTISDKGITIDLNITEAVFDGKPMKLLYNEKDKCIEAICFDSEQTVEFAKLQTECYMVFTMAVGEKLPAPVTAKDDGVITSEITAKNKTLKVCSPCIPVTFECAIEKTKTEGRE